MWNSNIWHLCTFLPKTCKPSTFDNGAEDPQTLRPDLPTLANANALRAQRKANSIVIFERPISNWVVSRQNDAYCFWTRKTNALLGLTDWVAGKVCSILYSFFLYYNSSISIVIQRLEFQGCEFTIKGHSVTTKTEFDFFPDHPHLLLICSPLESYFNVIGYTRNSPLRGHCLAPPGRGKRITS